MKNHQRIHFEILENPFQVNLEFNSDQLNYPVEVYFFDQHGICWQTKISSPGSWARGPANDFRELSIRIIDSIGDVIFSYDYIFSSLSDRVEKKFINWCRDFIAKKCYKPKGFIIGSHDGRSGEWVQAYLQGLTDDCLIVEPNIAPFLQLTYNYKNESKFTFKNCVISESDDYVDFYTDDSGNSESSSLIESNYLAHQNKGYKKIKVKSYNPNTLLQGNIPDYIHIDAEGYDGNIIMLLNDEILNSVKFIIWEHIHLSEEMKSSVSLKLAEHGFTIEVGQIFNTCAYKS
jgi:FkbM family methyltransferase